MRSAKSGPDLCCIWQVFGLWASPYGVNGQMTMTVHNHRPRQFHIIKQVLRKVHFCSAVENVKSWVTQRTTHCWGLGGLPQFWVVCQLIICWGHVMKSIKTTDIDIYKLQRPLFAPWILHTVKVDGIGVNTRHKPWQKQHKFFFYH